MGIRRLASGRDGPTLRYGVLAIGLILWYALVWDPLSAKRDAIEVDSQAKETEIGRLKRDIERHRTVDQRLKQVKRELAAREGTLVAGETPQGVAASLQDSVLKLASETGQEVVTYKTGPARKWEDYQVAVVTFTFKTGTRKLVGFLKRLEEDRRAMRLRSLNVVGVQGREPHLRTTIEVEALCL